MGLFRKSKGEEDTGFNVITLSGTAPAAEADEEVIELDFLTTFDDDVLDDEDETFDYEDFELANKLHVASREELLGSATVYLAAAENGTDSDYATIAMAYIALAATRPATPQDV